MPFWEKFKSFAKAVVEGQAYSSGYFAPDDWEEQEAEAVDVVNGSEKE